MTPTNSTLPPSPKNSSSSTSGSSQNRDGQPEPSSGFRPNPELVALIRSGFNPSREEFAAASEARKRGEPVEYKMGLMLDDLEASWNYLARKRQGQMREQQKP